MEGSQVTKWPKEVYEGIGKDRIRIHNFFATIPFKGKVTEAIIAQVEVTMAELRQIQKNAQQRFIQAECERNLANKRVNEAKRILGQ